MATIKQARPDLLPHISSSASPIPSQIPAQLRKPTEFIQDIGEPINACFLVDSDIDPTGWFLFLFL